MVEASFLVLVSLCLLACFVFLDNGVAGLARSDSFLVNGVAGGRLVLLVNGVASGRLVPLPMFAMIVAAISVVDLAVPEAEPSAITLPSPASDS